MAEKVTIKKRYEEVREILEQIGRDDLVEFIDGRIAQQVRKSTTERKPTARQTENEVYKEDIVNFMNADQKYTANEIMTNVPSIIASGMSVNRVSALLTQLVNANVLARTTESRKNYYALIGE